MHTKFGVEKRNVNEDFERKINWEKKYILGV